MGETTSRGTSTIHVLHVDDEPDFADIAATFLERESDRLTVSTAMGPNEGLDQLADQDFDCIVSDYDMPGRNGIEFLTTVREEYPDLPFILYTGKGSEEVASEAISAGVTEYMQKETGADQYTILANRIINSVEQYRTRIEAERTQQRLREITESTTDCRWMFTADWDELLFISGYEEIWNRPESAIKDDPRDFLNGVHPDDQDFVRDGMDRLSNGESVDIEYRIVRGDGSYGHVWVKGEPVFDDSGNVVRVVGLTRDVTERKKQERRYKAIFNHTYQFTGLLEPEGTLIEANETALEFGGLDHEDVLGKKMWETYWFQHSEDTRTRAREAVEQAANGEFVRHELPVQGATDEVIIDFSVRPLTDEQGNVTLLIPEGRDITELKEQERELRETKRRLDLVLEGTETGFWEWNMETDDVEWNESLERAFGLEPGSFEGTYEAFAKRVHPDDFPQVQEAIEQAIESGQPYHAEFRMIHEAGDIIWTEAQGIIIEEEDGPDQIVGLFRDITERKEREQELKRHQQIVEDLNDIATIIDSDGTITYVSPAVRRVLGYDPEELTGENGFEYQPSETSETVAKAIKRVLTTPDESQTVQTRFRRADGSWCWIESTLRNRLDGEMIDGILVSSRDITERVHRRQELQQQNERLNEFANLLSHDLRNPLKVAEGRLELAQEDCDCEHLKKVGQAHDRMYGLIEDILTLAREGGSVTETESVDLPGVIDECWATVETADVSLVIETSQTVEADESRLKQVFENLFRNSVEHGGEDITVTVGEMDDGFCVVDNGPGIPEEERDNVFEAGYSTADEGTGFGLRIVKQVAQAHGWDVQVTNGSDGGARFEITGVTFTAE